MSVTTVITDSGFDLLRAAPGHKLIYTRAACGSGHVENTQLTALADISDFVMDLSIVEFKPTESAATLRLQLDNSKAPREFQLYQIGVFAKLMDGETELTGETLLQIMQYDQPDIVRAVPHVSEFVVNTLMGQAANVEGTIDLAAYVSIRQFNTALDEKAALNPETGRITPTQAPTADEVMVTSDQSVASSLRNKADKNTTWLNPVPTTWAELWRLESGTYTWLQYDPLPWEPEDTPNPSFGLRVFLICRNSSWGDTRVCELRYVDGVSNLAKYIGEPIHPSGSPTDGRWARLATATPPQEYDLPLSNGFHVQVGESAKYSKDQLGRCLIDFSVEGNIVANTTTVIGVVPIGYRPPLSRKSCGFASSDPNVKLSL